MVGWAFMVARVLFPWLTSWGNMMTPQPRATIKALPSPPTALAPTGGDRHFLRLKLLGGPLWSPAVPRPSSQLFVSLLLPQQRLERIIQDIFASQNDILLIPHHMLIIISLPQMAQTGEMCVSVILAPCDGHPRFQGSDHAA